MTQSQLKTFNQAALNLKSGGVTDAYFWFSPDTLEIPGFPLAGGRYQEISTHELGYLWSNDWSNDLKLDLGVLEHQLHYVYLRGSACLHASRSSPRSATTGKTFSWTIARVGGK